MSLKKIGKEWTSFSATHLSPSQLNKSIDQWFNDYCVLNEQQRKNIPANAKMIAGGLVGGAVQDRIVYNLTTKEVMEGTDESRNTK